ncbi:MAG: hypothetical protein LBS21_15950 [Clostridiales bacterium]|jgi:CRISPR-associated protein Cmr3|nr:hypothetical protein [Clostridiales bacterium]
MKVKINATDTLTFGVGKPSVWGEDSFGRGTFPPFPSVVRGAVRAGWLHENLAAENANTDLDETKNCYVSEYALLLNDEAYFPAPADYALSGEDTLIRCKLQKNDALSSLKTKYQLWAEDDGKLKTAEGRYISRSALGEYLAGGKIDASVSLGGYITDEDKTGFYRNRSTNTAKRQMLYNSPLKRLQNGSNRAALAANIWGIQFEGLVRFGGEGKTASFTQCSCDISPGLPKGFKSDDEKINENGEFKLYLATPAFFKSGCMPSFLNEENSYAELLTAAIYGYESIGGFDMQAKRPKQMLRAVKAGSVYYCRLRANTPDNRQKALSLHAKSISEFSKEDGFGICYIGKI